MLYDSVNRSHRIVEMYAFPKLFSAQLNPISHADNLSKNPSCEWILLLTSFFNEEEKKTAQRESREAFYIAAMRDRTFEYEHPFVNNNRWP